MTHPPERVVIVGAGECGIRTAVNLREHRWGGALIVIGEEPEVPYERPPLSKVGIDPTHSAGSPPIVPADRFAELDLEFIRGTAVATIDREHRTVIVDDGQAVPYDRLVLATGARARRPAIVGGDAILTLRTVADLRKLRHQLTPGARLVVIGGGFIGLEVAAGAVERGCEVVVLEFAHQLMSRVVPAMVANVVELRHREAGVDLRLGIGVESIESVGTRHRLQLTDGSSISCDVVVAGVGALPNTELAAACGLMVDNGIAVDSHLCTSDPAIFAGGDCCSFPHPLYGDRRIRLEAWRNAVEHAEVLAANVLGGERVCDTVPWFWSDQYELGLQIAGLHAAAVHDVVRRRPDGAEVRFGLNYDGRLVSASGVAEGTSIAKDIRLAEMLIAHRATPRVTELADPSFNLRSLLKDGRGES